MIERLLPADVSCAATRAQTVPDGTLFPEEEALVAKSVAKRRNDFATARACARRAMAGLGLPPVAVLHGHRGRPLWPEGIVGSLTHCDGYRAAALAHAKNVLSLGIDAEPHAPLPTGVRELVTLPAERARIGPPAPEGPGAIHWDRVLFSAKESVFKTWYPVTGLELDFTEADLTFHRSDGGRGGDDGGPRGATGAEGTFTARLLLTDPALPTTLHGRWRIEDGIVATAAYVRPDWRESVEA
ncbi:MULTISPECIES: 4'-phosphopantetheinyl transferase family protein [Streptomyces]|uniref:Phosphopantetheinyl transferase n=1 Tax=Streptomyces griseus subsp. griseus (strain JCM 4626 / CBS 651.72 / NBRC 13350 / KCC S-0626 / ISP 5235) TaxID=455632 RepID=B1VRS6_STRGG|nr:4'-phosphopantetheinyl transferase superfamily protein [Streptomyces griseus]MYR12193.1 4'-phosphopantetheinyl transferase superfamily protein [Streptomyces sp. SID724]BAG17494.1 putative phosphopantetheinyl transferase [Streptomyces griseus subsp. griseus NBRC 13350]SED72516.1 4'-phosphopantetheinyl transferase EntD (siderophore biosynthesis) [Streptomyces griseus]SQA24533.1 phosphopantetheinyl transferase [Streptomyces griseus]